MRDIHIQINQMSMTIPVEDNEPLRIPIEVSLDRTEETKITITVPGKEAPAA